MPDVEVLSKQTGVVRVMVFNDPHFSPSSPPAFKVSYPEHLKSNIEQCLRYARQNHIDALLITGDLFHKREPASNPLWLVAEVMEMGLESKDLGVPWVGIAGNHDIKFGNLETGRHGSPIDMLTKSKSYHLLDDGDYVIRDNEGKVKVRVAGRSYFHSKAEMLRDLKKKEADETLIVLGHFWFGAETGNFFGEPMYGPDFFEESELDILCIGHHHEDRGVIEIGKKKFVAHGSISITGAHGHDRVRRPAAAIIEITQGNDSVVKLIRPKCLPAEELIDLDALAQKKEEEHDMKLYISSLKGAKSESSDPSVLVEESDVPAEVKARAVAYLEAAEE